MADLYFFDTDCLSSFLLTNNENILFELFENNIYLPSHVLNEANKYEILRNKVNELLENGSIKIKSIDYGTNEFKIYHKLTSLSYSSKIIGHGEASAIALCVVYNGILVSNNLKDVTEYIEKFKLNSLTTPEILATALEKEIINRQKANDIWSDMLNKGRYLPNISFDEYYEK